MKSFLQKKGWKVFQPKIIQVLLDNTVVAKVWMVKNGKNGDKQHKVARKKQTKADIEVVARELALKSSFVKVQV